MLAVKECRAGSASTTYLDNMVWKDLQELAKETELIEQAVKQVLNQDSFDKEAQALERYIASQKELVEQFKEDLNSPALKGNARNIVLGLLIEAQEKLDKMQIELEKVKKGEVDYEKIKEDYAVILEWCKRVQNTNEEMTTKQKRDFLRLLGVVVKVYREDDNEHERYVINIKMPNIANGISKNIPLSA